MLKSKGIHVVPDFALSDVDNARTRLLSYDKKEVGYDLLVTVPVNKGAEVIGRSGMGDELNYVETDKFTLQSRRWPNVWTIGDAADVPAAKAGSVAHFMADALVENLCHHIRGETLPSKFDGHANCFIESGFNRALLIDYNYNTEPMPGEFPLPAHRTVPAAEGIGGQPLGQTALPLALLEPVAARPPALTRLFLQQFNIILGDAAIHDEAGGVRIIDTRTAASPGIVAGVNNCR